MKLGNYSAKIAADAFTIYPLTVTWPVIATGSPSAETIVFVDIWSKANVFITAFEAVKLPASRF